MFATLIATAAILQSGVAEDPVLRKDRDLNCAEWAKTANHYLRLGQEKAVAELLDRSGPKPTKFAIRPNHACHILRLLFDPKKGETLRQPLLGGLPGGLPAGPTPSERWPEFPFAVHAGVIFMFGEDYVLAGVAETPEGYVKYLQERGEFRTRFYSVPTGKEASRALDLFVRTARWREEFGGSTQMEELLRAQTKYFP
jgi:hypothetical protein